MTAGACFLYRFANGSEGILVPNGAQRHIKARHVVNRIVMEGVALHRMPMKG